MFVSVIIPTYKDIQALELILDALGLQTYKNFEVLIAEDDDSATVKELLSRHKSDFVIKHLFHEDIGNRKAIIMNKALLHVSGEYIIFIDGDTIPYTTFVESHVALSEAKTVLCGRRVNLGDKVSRELRERKITAYELEKHFFKYYSYIKDDNSRHYEQGVRFKPRSFTYKILSGLNKNVHILASNFSCFTSDIYSVNGFDENLPYAPNRDDTDLEWRMIASGCQLKSCKYSANLFHLNHLRNDRKEEGEANMKLIHEKQKNNEYICKNGIKKYE